MVSNPQEISREPMPRIALFSRGLVGSKERHRKLGGKEASSGARSRTAGVWLPREEGVRRESLEALNLWVL